MTDDGFDGRSSPATLSLFIALITVITFQRGCRQNDVGIAKLFLAPITAVTNGMLNRLAPGTFNSR